MSTDITDMKVVVELNKKALAQRNMTAKRFLTGSTRNSMYHHTLPGDNLIMKPEEHLQAAPAAC